MNLSKLQLGVIISSVVLLLSFVVLGDMGYTVPTTKKGETSDEEPKELLTEEIVLAEARNLLDSAQTVWLAELDKEKAQAKTIAKEAEVLKLISRTWFEYGNYIVSGYYARKVAELLDTGKAWGIAGTTYGMGFNSKAKNDEKILAARQAISALEKAKVLEPDTLQHAINEGLMYLELSSVDASVMPMKGVGMLQGLAKQRPDNVMINMTLARLSATRSGDLAKAKPRLEKVLAIAEKKSVSEEVLLEANYFLIDCYKAEKNKEKVLFHYDNTIRLSASKPSMQEQMVRAKQNYINNN
jgi:tetratricopeptide (TPR) repeat protein